MVRKGPSEARLEGIRLMKLAEMFPDEAAATAWFESLIWPRGHRCCPRCGSQETSVASATSGLPYYCSVCRRAYSVRIGTALERSKVPLRKWVFAIYLEMTSPKGTSSMKLHRDINVTQKTAWFMLHRIREAWLTEVGSALRGSVEADEAYMRVKRRKPNNSKRKALKRTGRGADAMVADSGLSAGART